MQLILVGQPELRAMLGRPDLEQFAQRIVVDYHLDHLGLEETGDYIRHRVTVAGGDPALFEPAACELVYQSSRGIPRLINILCDIALVYGYAVQKKTIDAPVVQEVARDKAKGGLFGVRDGQANLGSILQKAAPDT